MSHALLWLEAPLQSWGHDSRFGKRATLPFPSRSVIMGMLCCAMGKGGAQRQWLEKMRPMALAIHAFARNSTPGRPCLRCVQIIS